VNGRGRWKKTRRVVDRYLDVEQEFVDAKVQAALCVGGPIKYKLVEGSGVCSAWYDQYVVPGIKEYFGVDNTISDVLALPLLYASMEIDLVHTVPLTIVSRIRQAYEEIRVLAVDVNPVEKVRLDVHRVQDRLMIDEMIIIDGDHDVAGGLLAYDRQQNNDTNMMQQLQQIKEQIATQYNHIQQSVTNLRIEISEKHSIIQRNINRIFIQPPRQATTQQRREREAHDNVAEAAALFNEEHRTQQTAELSKTPRNLFDLWIEYQHGIGGNKAAKDFTYTERGKCKFKYCRRKVVWDCISKHVNAGYLAATAIDRIYQCYGRSQNVSAIIVSMVHDKRTGGHPNLRI
jgi:hypothetical protein